MMQISNFAQDFFQDCSKRAIFNNNLLLWLLFYHKPYWKKLQCYFFAIEILCEYKNYSNSFLLLSLHELLLMIIILLLLISLIIWVWLDVLHVLHILLHSLHLHVLHLHILHVLHVLHVLHLHILDVLHLHILLHIIDFDLLNFFFNIRSSLHIVIDFVKQRVEGCMFLRDITIEGIHH